MWGYPVPRSNRNRAGSRGETFQGQPSTAVSPVWCPQCGSCSLVVTPCRWHIPATASWHPVAAAGVGWWQPFCDTFPDPLFAVGHLRSVSQPREPALEASQPRKRAEAARRGDVWGGGHPVVAFLRWHHLRKAGGGSSSGFAEPWCSPGAEAAGEHPPPARNSRGELPSLSPSQLKQGMALAVQRLEG